MITETDKAWLAGFIDGEGFIGIIRQQKNTNSQQAASWLYHPMIVVTNTSEEAIEKVQVLVGESKKALLRRTAGHKLGIQIKVTKFEAILRIIREIRPYLAVKNKQADLLNKFCECRLSTKVITGRGSRGNTSFGVVEEEIFNELKKLNERGDKF